MNRVNLVESRITIRIFLLLFLLMLSTVAVKAQNKTEAERPVCELPAFNIEPEFIGGNFEEYVYKNLEYPKKAKRKKTTGKVIASFVIEKDGTISNIIILKSLPDSCDEAVINVIKRMPKWRPAMQNGKLARFTYELPVEFGVEIIKKYKRAKK